MTKLNNMQYNEIIALCRANNARVRANVSEREYKQGDKYYISTSAVSGLSSDGFMFGLCKFGQYFGANVGLHQQTRIEQGGYFLECYEGKLSKMYKENGFHIVARVPWDDQYLAAGELKHKPDIVFMSLYNHDTINADTYEHGYEVAKNSKYNGIKS